MKVILTQNVDNLGKTGDVVSVSNGYARNYLLPKKLVLLANDKSVKDLEHQKKIIESKINKEKKEAQKLADKLNLYSCTIQKKVGENEKIFGSVTSADIEEALQKDGFNISRKNILLEEPIKALGVYTIPVKVMQDLNSNIKVWVVQD